MLLNPEAASARPGASLALPCYPEVAPVMPYFGGDVAFGQVSVCGCHSACHSAWQRPPAPLHSHRPRRVRLLGSLLTCSSCQPVPLQFAGGHQVAGVKGIGGAMAASRINGALANQCVFCWGGSHSHCLSSLPMPAYVQRASFLLLCGALHSQRVELRDVLCHVLVRHRKPD